jgi:DNA replication protein DnaC
VQVPAAVLQTIVTQAAPRSCSCGAVIEPVRAEGFPDYYPRLCPSCEVIHARAEEAVREEQLRRGQGIPPLYLGSTFDNLREPRPSQAVISTCKLYAAGPRQGQGLYLWSHVNGNGKSHLAAAILMRHGDGFFVNAIDLFDALKDCFATGERCRPFDAALSAPLLVLDDFGTQKPGEWAEGRLYRLINTRTSHLLPTVITSNYSPDELEPRVGPRIASRIVGSCAVLHVDGPDHRKLRRRDLI